LADQASGSPPLAADVEQARLGRALSEPRRAVRVAVVIIGWSLLIGVAFGPLWAAIAPGVEVTVREGGAFLNQEQGALLIGVDGWYTVLAIVAGIVSGALAWWRFRHEIVGMLAGAAIGGLLGSLLAWQAGRWFGPGPLRPRVEGATDGTVLAAPLDLAAKAALLVWPIAAVSVIFLLALIEPRHPPGGRHASGAQLDEHEVPAAADSDDPAR
jgi:hypothetical protein